MSASVNERVHKRRENLRKQGLRPVQIWMPDTRRAGFADEYRRQARIVAASDRTDNDLMDFLDEAAADLDGLPQ